MDKRLFFSRSSFGTQPMPDQYQLKGFMAYGALAANEESVVATLGELSVRSETFAKDRALYTETATGLLDSTLELSVFSSKRLDTGVNVPVPDAYAELLMQLGQWIWQQAQAAEFSEDEEVFRQQTLSEFNGKIINLTVGEMVQQDTIWLPQFITFYINPDSLGVTYPADVTYLEDSRVRIWFSDSAFAAQYDEYVIECIAPVANLDDLFLAADTVKTNVQSRTVPQLMELIHDVAGNNPYTLVRSFDFNYVSSVDPTNTFPTTWTFVIYGVAGDTIDAIKFRLIDWILENSSHTREEWAELFPDIFASTEFIIVPLWNHYAIPNMTLEEGVYSPVINHASARTIAQAACTGVSYTPNHIDNMLAIVGSTYKSIALMACGGPENRNGISRFEEQWPDYMAVSTSHIDFNRMHPDTQEWIMLLFKLLQAAEEMTEFSDVPVDLTRMKRVNADGDEVLYTVASYKSVQYLVVTKSWLLGKFPPINPDPTELSIAPAVETFVTPLNSQQLTLTFHATGGEAPYTFAATSPQLASGGIDADTGEFDGTFNAWGIMSLQVQVTDTNGVVATRDYVIEAYQSA